MTDRNQALTFCLVTFFKLYGFETVYKQTYLEKIPVFVSKQNNRVGFARLTGKWLDFSVTTATTALKHYYQPIWQR